MTRTTGVGGIGLIAGALLIASVGAVSAKELKSVGVAVRTMGNPFFGALVKGVNDEAHRINPNVSVTTVSADYELNKQFTQIDNHCGRRGCHTARRKRPECDRPSRQACPGRWHYSSCGRCLGERR